MTTADRIAAKFQASRPKFAGAFHADHYDIERVVRVPDGSGGWTNEPGIAESGRCSLDVTQGRGSEAVAGSGVVTSIATYTAELPYESTLAASDALIINGRPFHVIDVKRDGEMGLFTIATLEDRQ